MLMLFSVIAPAIKGQFADLVGTDVYDFLARSISAIAISGVVLLGLMSLQIVRDVTAVYEWNNGIEEQDAITQAQRDAQKKFSARRPSVFGGHPSVTIDEVTVWPRTDAIECGTVDKVSTKEGARHTSNFSSDGSTRSATT
nr:hypothetical protein GCM10025699_56440 [Microbacterium flavescens]